LPRIAEKLVENNGSEAAAVVAAGQGVVTALGGIGHLFRVAEKLVDNIG
jgi:hypothetical protein